jgi:L-lactate dehydrogenase complex protein LldG
MDSRETILSSIRTHLAASEPHEEPPVAVVAAAAIEPRPESLVELFKQSLEVVSGHCIIAHGEREVVDALTRTITRLQQTKHRARSIAISDAPMVDRLIRQTDLEIDELAVAPDAHEVFRFDVGISTAQAAIAETGTLVLDASAERHRFVSLVPPVHIAIIESAWIYHTLGEALAFVHRNGQINPSITFVSGPSRTADIELTLAIGVHGPQELYVIVNDNQPRL